MTIFVPSNMPASVNTLEKVVAWSCGATYQLQKFTKYQESDDSPLVPVITAQDGLAADKNERIIFRVSLHLGQEWRQLTTKFWQDVQEYPGSAPIPTSFLT